MSDVETKTQIVLESEGEIEHLSSKWPPEPRELEDASPPPERIEGPTPEVRPALHSSFRCCSANFPF